MEVVDDQYDGLGVLGDLRQDAVDYLVHVGYSGRRWRRLTSCRARRAADRVEHGAPEPLFVLLVALDGHERDPTKLPRMVSPRAQQRGLPTSRRRRDDRQTFGHGPVKQPKETFPVQHAPGTRNVSGDRLRNLLPTPP